MNMVLCLCGDLGQSEYIWHKFQQYCSERLDNECQLVTDDRAWSAVVRGAAVRGLDGSMVVAKRAKVCYGIEVHQKFREDFDSENESFDCPVKLEKRAPGYVDWVVKRGRRFVPGFIAKSDVYEVVLPEDDEDDLEFNWTLYTCDADEAPIHTKDQGVKKAREIHLKLHRSFKRQKKSESDLNEEDEARAVQFRVVFKLGETQGTLKVLAMHHKKVVGKATIDYARGQS